MNASIRILRTRNTVVVQLRRDQWVCEFAKPELQETRRNVWIVDPFEVVVPTLDANLELADAVPVSWDTEDALGF